MAYSEPEKRAIPSTNNHTIPRRAAGAAPRSSSPSPCIWWYRTAVSHTCSRRGSVTLPWSPWVPNAPSATASAHRTAPTVKASRETERGLGP
jgi:hypothetical protein